MVSTQRRSRSSRSEVASRLLIARMPVKGVRTSCAKAASAASTVLTAPPRWRGEAFAALVEVRFLTCRFFVCRFLDGGALRFPRDPFAMIPYPTTRSMAWPNGQSHGGDLALPPEKLRQADQAADVGRTGAAGAQFPQAG